MTTTVMTVPQTLAHLLAEGPVTQSEALRYAICLAEALRRAHEAGKVHGALSPSNIAIAGAGLELMDAPDQAETVTPYTAPEVLQGHAADARSDIFGFGAIAYEIFTGHRAFEGESEDALVALLVTAVLPPTGNLAFDRLIANCIARDPAARRQRMQRVILELKLVAGDARRADEARNRQRSDVAVRAEMQQLEARLAARLQADEEIVGGMRQATRETVTGLRDDISTIESLIASGERSVEALGQRILAHVDENIEATGQRIAGMEQGIEALRDDVTALEKTMDNRLSDLEHVLMAQVRAAQEQTDDLVERVVETLEALQAMVFEHMSE